MKNYKLRWVNLQENMLKKIIHGNNLPLDILIYIKEF